VNNLHDLMNKTEDLHPDLVPYLEPGPLGQAISHPLIVEICHADQMNALVNERYRHKLKELEAAKEAGDWDQFVWLHARPYRLNALLEAKEITPEMITEVWIDAESPGINRDVWLMLFARIPNDSLDKLPEKLTIYRGTVPEDENGISWTLDRKTAEFFAKRFNNGNGIVKTLEIAKEDALFYSNDRGEQEIIYNPLEND